MGPEPRPDVPVPGMHIWGWMSNVELLYLGEAAARMDSVVEIGCLHGRSAFALLTACPGTVYCIDPWIDTEEKHDAWPSFWENCGHFPNLVPIRGHSPADAWRLGTGQQDMTFIDGAHAYEAVLADICEWLPRTRRLICGHDYSNADGGYPGVSRAVQEVFGDRVVVPELTSIWTVDLEVDRSIAAGLPTGPVTWTDEYGVTSTYDFRWPT